IALNELERRAIFRWPVLRLQQLRDRPKQQCQRRAELMADVREESGLYAVELRQRFSTRARFFVGARVRDRRADLPGHEIDKRRVVLIERKACVESEDEF